MPTSRLLALAALLDEFEIHAAGKRWPFTPFLVAQLARTVRWQAREQEEAAEQIPAPPDAARCGATGWEEREEKTVPATNTGM
jgi:hypothetical protein